MSRFPLGSSLVVCLVAAACAQSTPKPAGGAGGAGTAGAAGSAAGAGTAGSAMTAGSGGGAGAGTAGSGGVTTTGGGGAGTSGSAGGAGSGGAGTGGAGGGAGTAGGSPDAGAADAKDGSAGGCAYKLCDSFENAAPGATGSPWMLNVDKKGTVVETVADKGHTGTHSVHVKVSDMAGVFGYITETQSLAATGMSFWGRVYLWSDIPTPTGHEVHIAVDAKTAANASEQDRILNVINGHLATNRRSDDMGKVSNVAPPMGKWACYEWHITPTDLHVYLEGAELPVAVMWVEPTLSLLRIGFERFTMGSAGDLWIDDVALDGSQIGCN
jgi:hypothetical protein